MGHSDTGSTDERQELEQIVDDMERDVLGSTAEEEQKPTKEGPAQDLDSEDLGKSGSATESPE